jgi:hypothetical protein
MSASILGILAAKLVITTEASTRMPDENFIMVDISEGTVRLQIRHLTGPFITTGLNCRCVVHQSLVRGEYLILYWSSIVYGSGGTRGEGC